MKKKIDLLRGDSAELRGYGEKGNMFLNYVKN